MHLNPQGTLGQTRPHSASEASRTSEGCWVWGCTGYTHGGICGVPRMQHSRFLAITLTCGWRPSPPSCCRRSGAQSAPLRHPNTRSRRSRCSPASRAGPPPASAASADRSRAKIRIRARVRNNCEGSVRVTMHSHVASRSCASVNHVLRATSHKCDPVLSSAPRPQTLFVTPAHENRPDACNATRHTDAPS